MDNIAAIRALPGAAHEPRVMWTALLNRNTWAMHQMLMNGWPPEDPSGRNSYLVDASFRGDVATVELLLQYGAHANAMDRSVYPTPLAAAAFTGDLRIAKDLLRYGANPALRLPGGRTAVSVAHARRHYDIVRLLSRYELRTR